ncbi:diguanylate cyclase [Croceicoccus estronivorus]|uniref:EAL domain-containing protein n=1 Tax=Croceicoccus estronivorus TaxID=1172626 RepID=UPI0008312B45|nr:EAL domain-containing protein [Croceicoccus estronivorus]OCC23104.1 diguanylate cyclase [Croceicoccus estronivorus]
MGKPAAVSGENVAQGSAGSRVALPPGQRIRDTRPLLESRTRYDQVVSPHWWFVGPAMVLALVFVGLGERVLPPPAVTGLGFVAALIAFSARYLSRFEGDENEPLLRRMFAATILVILPMALFGFGISHWASLGGIDWRAALAALIAVTALGSLIQASRRHMILTVNVPIWTAVVMEDGNLIGAVALLLCLPIAVFASLKQIAILRAKREASDAEARLQRRAQEILRGFEETGQGWFWETDRRGTLTYLSFPVSKTIGRKYNSLVGYPFATLFDTTDNEGERTLAFHLSARSSFHDLTVRARVSDGMDEERWWSITGRPMYDDFGNFAGFRGSGHDLTEKKRSQDEASRLAQYDSLTGLANRYNMLKTLDRLMEKPHTLSRSCAVLLLDLDRFKQVNDTMGHPVGDVLLEQVSQRLQQMVGAEGQVGRLGGDEFKVILAGRPDRERLAYLAHEIIANLSQPYSIEGHRVVIGASIGIAIAPEHGETSDELIRNADLALYAAKDGGRGRYHFFADDLHSQAEERRQLEQDLRDAIHNGGLELHYQPVVETATEEITGFEALLRWNHPEKGPLSPTKFVEVAEDTGLISAIGEWALRTACHDLARWPEKIRVAVNVSPLQFANPQLPAIVTNAIARAGVAPGRLELEITESAFLNDDEETGAMFAALKRVGVRLALDDFGTGYSSLGYLKKAPFDKIKIDQSFVRGATQPGSRNGAIIASITSLAQSLGMDTTAEGVETLDELELVRQHGCSHIQGFIYEQVLTAQDATERLNMGLKAVPRGPRCTRAARRKMLRKVVLDHEGQLYSGTIRNISYTGALVQGLWNVPPETVFSISFSDSHQVIATCRWCDDDMMGVEFTVPLERDMDGNVFVIGARGRSDHGPAGMLSKAG